MTYLVLVALCPSPLWGVNSKLSASNDVVPAHVEIAFHVLKIYRVDMYVFIRLFLSTIIKRNWNSNEPDGV